MNQNTTLPKQATEADVIEPEVEVLIDKLDVTEPVKTTVREIVKSVTIRQMSASPIPFPSDMAKYERLYPGATKFFIETHANQQNEEALHRRQQEAKIVDANISDVKKSRDSYNLKMVLSFILSLILIIFAYLALSISPWVSGVTITGGIGTIILAFLHGKSSTNTVPTDIDESSNEQ